MPAWDSLSENSKRLFAHQMEVYAGYSENADHHVGRLLAAIEEMGELDNTVVIWIWVITAPAWKAPLPARSTRERWSTGSR